jgi:hypothetical protein
LTVPVKYLFPSAAAPIGVAHPWALSNYRNAQIENQSVLVQKDTDLLELASYVVLNPV